MAKKVKLLRIREVAAMLSINPETLRRWDRLGKLKAVRIGNRRGVGDRRYKLEDIKAIIKKGT